MELTHRPRAVLVTTCALAVAAAAVLAPGAPAAPKKTLKATIGKATFSTGFETTKDGGRLSWKLEAAKLGPKTKVAVRLLVPFNGKPLALTLCTACRSTEVGQAVVAADLAKEIGAGKAKVEIQPAKGKKQSAPLT